MKSIFSISDKLQNHLLLHFIVFLWGFTAILIALINIDALPMVWMRMSIATIILWGYFILTKKSLRITKKQAIQFLIGGVMIASHWIMFFLSIKTSNVSVTLVMVSMGAFFAALLEPLFFRRKVRWNEIILGVSAVLGISIIFNVETEYFWGIVYGLLASFLSALFSVYNGVNIKDNEPIKMSFYQLFFGVCYITIILSFIGGFDKKMLELNVLDWTYLFLLSSFCTAYAFAASIKVLKSLSPFTVMLTINLEPVYGIILALLVFPEKEKMSTNFYLGALIVLLSVLFNAFLKNRKQLINSFKKIKN